MGCGRRWASNPWDGRSWGRRRTEELGNGQGGGEDVSPAKPSARKLLQVNHSEPSTVDVICPPPCIPSAQLWLCFQITSAIQIFAPAAVVCEAKRLKASDRGWRTWPRASSTSTAFPIGPTNLPFRAIMPRSRPPKTPEQVRRSN